MRSGIAFDVLRRWLSYRGLDVLFVRNVTDIDDKILRKAEEAGRPWWEWAATHEREFTKAYDALGVLPPSAEPRATGFVTQMITYMERLIERGHAYASDGNVYFDVASLPEYGALSGHKLEDVHQGRARAPASAMRSTSRCGRRPSRVSPRGRRRGATDAPVGIWSARRWRPRCWVRSSTSIAVAWT